MEQEKQEAPVQGKKKRLSTPLLIFIILMAVTAVLCTIVAGIWLHGRSSCGTEARPPPSPPAARSSWTATPSCTTENITVIRSTW